MGEKRCSMLAVHLLRGGLMKSADRLQLIGHGSPSSSAQLLSNRILEERVTLRAKVSEFIEAQQVSEGYETTRQALPDARVFAQPFVTWHTMHSTPNTTANSALMFLTAALADNATPLHGQVLLCGEFLGIKDVCGVPSL